MWKFLKRTISEQESHQIWSFLKRKKSEHISHQMWEFLKRKITEKKSHQIWWFLKRTNLKRFHHIKCESSWIGTCLKKITSYIIVLGKGKKFLRHAMSICRYVDMSMCFDVVTATVRNLRRLVGILFTTIFSPFCDTERNATWTPEFIIVHHSSSRIQELSPDIHVPCYGHTHYVSFFAGPSWWRYWETSRILCMMLSTLKNRTVIGDHHPILLEKTYLFATTTIIPLILVI